MVAVPHGKPILGRHSLRACREAAGLTQDHAAQLMGLSRTQLSKIEAGKSPYTQRHLEAAAATYGVTVARLNEPA